jgi:hypothetical protein
MINIIEKLLTFVNNCLTLQEVDVNVKHLVV